MHWLIDNQCIILLCMKISKIYAIKDQLIFNYINEINKKIEINIFSSRRVVKKRLNFGYGACFKIQRPWQRSPTLLKQKRQAWDCVTTAYVLFASLVGTFSNVRKKKWGHLLSNTLVYIDIFLWFHLFQIISTFCTRDLD